MTDIESTATDPDATTGAAQIAADAPESNGQVIAPAEPDAGDSVDQADDADTDGDAGEQLDDTADVFPRAVVEKLRKQSAGLRDRARTAEGRAEQAETRLAAAQRQLIGRQAAAAGVKPAAVFAVAPLDELLADDGTVDTAAVTRAMATASTTLGAGPRRNPVGRGSFLSGATGTNIEPPPKSFTEAFRPRED